MTEQIQTGDYEHYLREPEWSTISDDGRHIWICLLIGYFGGS